MDNPFSHYFMQGALMTGFMLSVMTSMLGPLMVQRKMSFMGSGLSHAAFGGVALGLLIGMPNVISMLFTVAVAIAIVWIQKRSQLSADTVIGILFSLAMALGIVFLTLRDEYGADAFSYLFGSILVLDMANMYQIFFVLFVMGAGYFMGCWSRLAYATFDRKLALVDHGKKVYWDEYYLAIVIALVIVVSIKLVGVLLVSAFLIVPAAGARLISQTFYGMGHITQILSMFSVAAGLTASYYLDMPSGPCIVLMQVLLFGGCFVEHVRK